MKGGAHFLSLCHLNLPQLLGKEGIHLLLGEQREFFAHLTEGDFDPGTYHTESKHPYNYTSVPHYKVLKMSIQNSYQYKTV